MKTISLPAYDTAGSHLTPLVLSAIEAKRIGDTDNFETPDATASPDPENPDRIILTFQDGRKANTFAKAIAPYVEAEPDAEPEVEVENEPAPEPSPENDQT